MGSGPRCLSTAVVAVVVMLVLFVLFVFLVFFGRFRGLGRFVLAVVGVAFVEVVVVFVFHTPVGAHCAAAADAECQRRRQCGREQGAKGFVSHRSWVRVVEMVSCCRYNARGAGFVPPKLFWAFQCC